MRKKKYEKPTFEVVYISPMRLLSGSNGIKVAEPGATPVFPDETIIPGLAI